jgi:hypothetical protein
MVDWTTGQPNARYQVLRLLRDNFGPGDKLVANLQTGPFPPPLANYVYYQGFLTRDGKRRLLLVNKRDRAIEVSIPGANGGRQDYVDQATASGPPVSKRLDSETVSLGGYAVAAVTLP